MMGHYHFLLGYMNYCVNYNFMAQTNQPIILTEAAAINTVIPKRCRWFHGFFADYFDRGLRGGIASLDLIILGFLRHRWALE